ncbi:MAG: hypothetical protein NC097_02285 [Clostridium sp.]|nr:hypothetical protein [Clostridium sp.]
MKEKKYTRERSNKLKSFLEKKPSAAIRYGNWILLTIIAIAIIIVALTNWPHIGRPIELLLEG